MFKAVLVAMSLSLGWAVQTNEGCTCADACGDTDGSGKWCNTKPGCDWSWDYCGSGDAEREGVGMGSLADDIADAKAAPGVDTSDVTVPDCPACGLNEQLSKDEIALAMTLHNQMRATVGTPPLKWNCKLMCQIQQHADTCVFEHSDSFNAPIPAGENLASGSDGATAAWMWFSEYGAAGGGQADFNCCGHYTAMVWKATKEFGCGKCTDTTYLCQYTNAQPNFGGASDFAANVPIFDGSVASYNKGGLDVATARKMFSQFSSWGFASMPSLYDASVVHPADVVMPRQGLFSIAKVPFVAAGSLAALFVVALAVKHGLARARTAPITDQELLPAADQENMEEFGKNKHEENSDKKEIERLLHMAAGMP